MQKFTVITSKGPIHTSDFRSAMKILEMELEYQRSQRRKEEPQPEQDWDKEFQNLLEQYIPKNKEETIQKKYEGGEG